MRRVDLLKTQLTTSRGRFFTASYKSQTGLMLNMNMKVVRLITSTAESVIAEVYIPKLASSKVMTFNVGRKGDLSYLSADRSTVHMSGLGMTG